MRTTILTAACLALLAGGCSRESEPAKTPATAPATGDAAAVASVASKEVVFAQEELDQMVAPIALYPDPLLAQVLMASTYPGDVADAATWSETHPDAQGDEAVKQVASEPWDPSVQSLVAFPQALAVLGQDPAWVQRLGDAFLAQPDDVMDAVQRLRRQAQTAGNLASNEYQQVSVQAALAADAAATGSPVAAAESGGGDQTIVIQPSDPQVVYVPSYDPTTVYGTWAYPTYPPVYYPPPPRYYPVADALVSGMMFGVGMAITDSLWGGFDWGHDDIDIDINRYNNINVNQRLDVNQNRWEHNPAHRDGVPYRDQAHRAANGRQLDGARDRDAFRGDDAQRTQAREQARAKMGEHGIDAPARTNQEARERAQAASGRMPDRDASAAREHAGERMADRSGAAPGEARHNAQAATDRARSNPQASRERAAAAAQQHPQAKDRASSAAQQRSQAAQRTQPAHKQTQSNHQARTTAQNYAQQTQRGGNSALNGVREPSRSHAQSQRGNASQAAAHRPPSSRPAGKPVNRTAQAPQRQGGGRHR